MSRAWSLLGVIVVLAACQPAYPVGLLPDRSCIPEWPEECLGPEQGGGGTSGGEDGGDFACDPAPMLADGQREAYSCLPRQPDGECPAADSECATDAMDVKWTVDCRECLREIVEIACGPDPAVDDACCYRLVVTSPDGDACD